MLKKISIRKSQKLKKRISQAYLRSTISIGQINSSRLPFKTFKGEIENFVLEVIESTAPGPVSELVHTE